MRSLIVEDEPVSRALLTSILAPLGECDAASSAEEALTHFLRSLESGEHFDLVCLDIRLPGSSGHDLLRMIREEEGRRGIDGLDGVRVLMISGASDKRSVLDAFRSGCEGYLVKPIEREVLLSRLTRLGFDVTRALKQRETQEVSKSETISSRSEDSSAPSTEVASLPEEFQIFLVESAELIDGADQALLAFEAGTSNTETVHIAFRALHTIKGNSGFLGLAHLEQLCHHGESLLDRYRTSGARPSPEDFEALFRLVDTVKLQLNHVAAHATDSEAIFSAWSNQYCSGDVTR